MTVANPNYRAQLEQIIRRKWGPVSPDKEQALSILLDNLTRIAELRTTASVSPVPFQGLNIPATRRELWDVWAGKDIAPMHQTTRIAAANEGITQENLHSIPEAERHKRIKRAIKGLDLTPGAVRPAGADKKGQKVNPLARGVALILIHGYRDITGSDLAKGKRTGLQSVAHEVFWILNIKEADAKSAIEVALPLVGSKNLANQPPRIQ